MKNSVWFYALVITGIMMSACTAQKKSTTFVNDEVYNTPSSSEVTKAAKTTSAANSKQVVTAPDKTSGNMPKSSSFADDYNDYSYSSRIQRFNNTDTTKTYFDDSYSSGQTQTSSSGSSSPNVSLYLGVGGGYGGWGSCSRSGRPDLADPGRRR